MKAFDKAVANLRPTLEQIGRNEAFFEAHSQFGEPENREENQEHAQGYMREFNTLRTTVTAIFPNIDMEKVHKALFDIYFDAWLFEKSRLETRLQKIYSEDKEVA